MATHMDDSLWQLQERCTAFAENNIALHPELHESDVFPLTIWEKMAAARVMGIGVPERFGGQGGSLLSLAVAGEALVSAGGNLGFALSWMIHHLIMQLILRLGKEDQQKQFLPELASGKVIGCLALSEPVQGSHPRYLNTKAVSDGDRYLLSGEKAYLTNGPIAGLYLVLAITDESDGRKQFSIFFVPKGTPGLQPTESLALPFLKPSPHGGLILKDTPVPAANLLGEKGGAYREVVTYFRDLEDTMMMGPIVGGMEKQLGLLVRHMRKLDVKPQDELCYRLGALKALLDTSRVIAYETAEMLAGTSIHPEHVSLLLTARARAEEFQKVLAELLEARHIIPDGVLAHMTADIVGSIRIASRVAKIKQQKLGETLLSSAR
ncbi:MAG: acyl-CoA dehydrogenase family protein [Smithellaceae bacterium]|nr:acyl-CoA dehydrogenase family protein [Smithellaceae bacterium]